MNPGTKYGRNAVRQHRQDPADQDGLPAEPAAGHHIQETQQVDPLQDAGPEKADIHPAVKKIEKEPVNQLVLDVELR